MGSFLFKNKKQNFMNISPNIKMSIKTLLSPPSYLFGPANSKIASLNRSNSSS